MEKDNRHSALGKTRYQLLKVNKDHPIVFNDLYIASFNEIMNWKKTDYKYISYEKRPIDLNNPTEIALLERLIKAELFHQTMKDYVDDHGVLRAKNPKKVIGNKVMIFEAFYFDIQITTSGEIYIGFDLKHRFEFRETLEEILLHNQYNLKKGEKVTDYINKRTYEYTFEEIASYTASEKSPLLNQSIFSYYEQKNQAWKIKNIPSDAFVVHVKNKEGQVFPYLARFLKRTCTFDKIPIGLIDDVNKEIKLEPNKRMEPLFKKVFDLLNKIPNLNFPKKNVLIGNSRYSSRLLESPSLTFGGGIKGSKIPRGLDKGGVFSPKNIKVSFFVDPDLHSSKKLVYEFINELKKASENFKVQLEVSYKPAAIREKLTKKLFQSKQLSLVLKSISNDFEGTVVVIGTRKNINKAYTEIKKEFGGKSDLNTQFVGFDEVFMEEIRQKKMFKLYNILLGIYAKSGVQPWVLGDQLFSDCFIGLDVSHFDGKHSSGIVQVIGKDGRLIRQTTTSTHESGEKISIDSLKDVVLDSIHAYQKVYQLYPKHITFHRDGLCREDLDSLEKLLSDLHIAFDYVEIIKSSNRRMAIYETSKGWYTKQGLYYTRDRTAYLCATNPHKSIGMAMPIKIIQKTSHLPFHQIIEDVYHLSFMHIHSLQKTRLPITTHYADISSYFHNKGLIHPRTKHTESLPFV